MSRKSLWLTLFSVIENLRKVHQITWLSQLLLQNYSLLIFFSLFLWSSHILSTVNSSTTPFQRLSKYETPDNLPNLLNSSKHTPTASLCASISCSLLTNSSTQLLWAGQLVQYTLDFYTSWFCHSVTIKNSVIISTVRNKSQTEKRYFHIKGFSLLQASLKYFIYITCIKIIFIVLGF